MKIKLLKPFGCHSMGYRHGYTLPLLLGWLENLVWTEGEPLESAKGKKAIRLEKVEDAIALLHEAMEMGDEE